MKEKFSPMYVKLKITKYFSILPVICLQKILLVFLFMCYLALSSKSQTTYYKPKTSDQQSLVLNSKKIFNLKAFAKAYGYIKYFHPSDEAYQIDWDKLAIYGAEKVENAKNNSELINSLNTIFQPIAPSVIFFKSKTEKQFDYSHIKPDNLDGYKTIAWQHSGVSFNMERKHKLYTSKRVNKEDKVEILKDLSGSISSAIDAIKYRGKIIKYSAYIKLKKGSGGTGDLWFKEKRESKKRGFFNNMFGNPIKKYTWEKYEIIGKVSDDAKTFEFGCELKGKGVLMIDDISLSYKDNEDWIEIPIKNRGFETSKITQDKGWSIQGNSYFINRNEKDVFSGKKSVSIKYKGNFKTVNGKPLFEKYPKVGEIIDEEIIDGITCHIPLALYGNQQGTYPKPPQGIFARFNDKLEKTNVHNIDNKYVRLANLIITYNVFQHFYPYFNEVKTNWDEDFTIALENSYKYLKEEDFQNNIQEFTAKLRDGHLNVFGGKHKNFVLPIQWEWIDQELVITKVIDKNLPIKVGDIVKKINDKTVKEYFDNVEIYISAATQGWMKIKSNINSLYVDQNKETIFTLENNQKVLIKRNWNIWEYQNVIFGSSKPKPQYKIINNNILYLDLRTIKLEIIKNLLPRLYKSKAIIYDLRGRPRAGVADFLLSHLLENDETSSMWLKVPQIIYPNFKKLSYYNGGWFLKAKKPRLESKAIFITDAHAISYAESMLSYIEGYNLGTIIGKPSAGTNGDMNFFKIPGGYNICFTGAKVVKHDKSQFHGVGVIPDVLVNKTIKGVKDGKDEFLEKAIEIANKVN